jgi:hypothetical protein
MFWTFMLAHFSADFLLQPDWMVRRRGNLWVLCLHAGIHFVMMFLLVGGARVTYWPHIALVALVHFAQDALKIALERKRPGWRAPAFIVDQLLHYGFLWIFVSWMQRLGLDTEPQRPTWVMVALVYLVITYVWFISERVFNLSNGEYLQDVNRTKFSRMLSRAGLVSLYLLVRSWAATGMAAALHNPYRGSKFHRRALVTDILVSGGAMLFLIWAIG